MPEVIETKAVCKQEGRYIGWPTVAHAPGGELVAVFSGDRDAHVCPFGKSVLVRSADDGRTWSEPAVVNDTPMDDRDTGLCACPDGTLVMTWFTSYYYGRYDILHASYRQSGKSLLPVERWKRQVDAITPEALEAWTPRVAPASEAESRKWTEFAREIGCELWPFDERYPRATRRMGYWTRRSRDGGHTWDDPTPAPVSTPHGANVLSNGDLIYVGTGDFPDEHGRSRLGVARSSDQGLTWKVLATVNATPNMEGCEPGETPRLCEPHVVETPSGKLLGLARCQVKDVRKRYLWQFESQDGGETWTEPALTGLLGFPPHLLRLRDGRILVSHAIRHEPPGQRFCFSTDEGRTWDIENQLTLTDAPSGDLGYPATVELDDGTLLSIYYQRERLDEKPCLMMTRWRG